MLSKNDEKLLYLHKVTINGFYLVIKIWDSVYTCVDLSSTKYSWSDIWKPPEGAIPGRRQPEEGLHEKKLERCKAGHLKLLLKYFSCCY